MKKSILLIIFLVFSSLIFAQSSKSLKVKGQKFSRNSFYVEILGNSIPTTVNYEHIWTKNGFLNIGTSIGTFYLPIDKFPTVNGTFETNFLFGKSANMFECSFGWTTAYFQYRPEDKDDQHYFLLNQTFRLGYRYQKPEGGFFFRGGLVMASNKLMVSDDIIKTLAWNFLIRKNVQYAMPGISLGYSF